MPASDDVTLALASRLRALDDAELKRLLDRRAVRAAGVKDFFDLADALLDPESIQDALARLDRFALTTLMVASRISAESPVSAPVKEADVAAHLSELRREAASAGVAATRPAGSDAAPVDPADSDPADSDPADGDVTAVGARLVDAVALALLVPHASAGFLVPPPVAQQLARWPEFDLPTLEDLVMTPAPTALLPVSGTESAVTDAASAEHAFATSTAIAELVDALRHEPARELARGGLALPDSKRLAARMGVDIDRVPPLVEIAERAGLIALDREGWMPAAASTDWLTGSSGERWARLAGAWLHRLPHDIRAILGARAHAAWGHRLQDYVDWLFPAGGDRMRERVDTYTRDAELLGITADHAPSSAGAMLLTDGPDRASATMAALFPPEVTQVYLQHDLSVVSPGPLAPHLDVRLRTMADVEGRALASSYRITAGTIHRAMAGGETAESIRSFLGGMSLSGVPQPLDYLIAEAGERFGLIRVAAAPDGRALVHSTDDTLLRTLLVDQSLASLALGSRDGVIVSRYDRATVFWALSEARYPVVAENERGEIDVLAPRQARRTPAAEPTDTTLALLERLRLGTSIDPAKMESEWMSRQLDVAIRNKMTLTVTVRLGDGSTTEMQLEPTGLASGRLRALDRKADIERTLPLSRITAVGPALSSPN